MNSSRCSSLFVLVLVCVLAVGTAGAVSVSDADAPSEAQAGTDVTATFELTDLYTDYNQWTLRGQTELSNVTWTVTVFNQAGDQMAQPSYDGQEFGHGIDINSGAHVVRVSVTGTVPTVSNFTYDPEEAFLLASLTQTRQEGSSAGIDSYSVHHYTEESREARQAIDDAAAAIDAAGGHAEAERTLASAISAYENENFGNAVDLADQARDTAEGAQSAQQRNRFIMMGVGALVLVGLGVGAVVYWRKSRTHSRL